MTKHKVVLVPFPFDDLSRNKVRPANCLTEPIGIYRHVVVAFVNSRIPDVLLPSDLTIAADGEGFAETGLRVASVIRLHRLMTLSTAIFERELGRLPSPMGRQVEDRLRRLFGV